MKKPLVINIISGKGGTGKSLIAAVLGRLIAQEGASVLLVDLDLFVRGLTHFFYLFQKERRIITKKQTVADFFGVSANPSLKHELAFVRFYEVDLLPAVSEIEEMLIYNRLNEIKESRLSLFFHDLRSTQYDFIIIDNRAGVDELILSSCELSDISISISEGDPVSRTTNDNLLRHLKQSVKTKVYTIFNKVRYIKTLDDYQNQMSGIRSDYEIAGRIPFDVDLFEKFGKPEFWDEVNSTMFTYGLAESWNKISTREDFTYKIDFKRFPGSKIWQSKKIPSLLSKFELASFSIGALFLVLYFVYDIILTGSLKIQDIFLIYGILLLLLPFGKRFMDTFSKNGD